VATAGLKFVVTLGNIMSRTFTSESVSSGHPDKLCDAISDAILDECISNDPNARVAVETLVKGTSHSSNIVLAGEVSLAGNPEIAFEEIARKVAADIGYTNMEVGMDALSKDNCEVRCLIGRQSANIAQGVDSGSGIDHEQGAGDQGIMFGYATSESNFVKGAEGLFMPVPILLSHRLTNATTEAMRNQELPWLRPDAKSQVSVKYNGPEPMEITSLVLAVQHDDLATDMFGGDISKEHSFIRSEVIKKIIHKCMPEHMLSDNTRIVINGTGRFLLGGPHADAGITGRKVIVDSYGGMGRHGGGAFSGKDPSKVDRSASYAARWAAKHVVAAGLADKCEIQVSYAIGVAEPTAIHVDTQGSGANGISDAEIERRVRDAFDFRPSSIIERLGLKRPIYRRTAAGGHFGRKPDDDGGFSWESLDDSILSSLA